MVRRLLNSGDSLRSLFVHPTRVDLSHLCIRGENVAVVKVTIASSLSPALTAQGKPHHRAAYGSCEIQVNVGARYLCKESGHQTTPERRGLEKTMHLIEGSRKCLRAAARAAPYSDQRD